MSTAPDPTPTDSRELTTEIRLSKTLAFVVGETEFRKLEEVATRVAPIPLEVEVYFSDGVIRTFHSLADLLAHDNSETSKIKLVSLKAEQYRPSKLKFSLDLGGLVNVSGQIRAEETTREMAVREVLRILRDARPWYNLIAAWNPSVIAALYLIPSVVMFASVVWSSIFQPSDIVERLKAQAASSMTPMFVFLIGTALVWPIDYLRRYLFPSSVFLIGAGEKRYKKLEIWRQIAIGIVIALVCGLVIEFVLHR